MLLLPYSFELMVWILLLTNVNLSDGLRTADLISIHSSGEDMILGFEQFNLMKEGVYLCNAARGGIIDENELHKALISGKVAGAWLDAFVDEPYNGILKEFDQVILTPHIGSYTIQGRKKMEIDAVNNLIKGLNLKLR